MKHQIFKYGTFKRSSIHYKKIFLFSQCYIMKPLNHEISYLQEGVNQLFNQSKANIFNQSVGFFFNNVKVQTS